MKQLHTKLYFEILNQVEYSTSNLIYWKIMTLSLDRHIIVESIKNNS
jgi:hypothetical protein